MSTEKDPIPGWWQWVMGAVLLLGLIWFGYKQLNPTVRPNPTTGIPGSYSNY